MAPLGANVAPKALLASDKINTARIITVLVLATLSNSGITLFV